MHKSNFIAPKALHSSNIYEVNIRQYTAEGTFKAFQNHLPRLKNLGVNILWLMPIYPIGIENRKGILGSYYSIQDFKAVNAEFGTDTDFKNLVNAAHDLGMKIILDWVANHTSWDNVWTTTNPEYFVKNEDSSFASPFDWEDVIQINHKNEAQQNAMQDAMQYWITNFNIDGFRADMAHLTPLQFWINARTKLSPLKKDLIWLAETEDEPYVQAFDITYTWKWMHASEKICKQQIILAEGLQVLDYYETNFPKTHARLFFTSNHDENSWTANEFEKYGIFTKAMAIFSCLYKSVPLIYSGQEVGNPKRLQFFNKDEIDWTVENDYFSFYQTLLQCRANNSKLFEAGNIIFYDKAIAQNILCYKLTNVGKELLVCLNFRNENCFFAIENIAGMYKDVFTSRTMELHGLYNFAGEAGAFLVLEKMS
jgi:alpha-amylase